MTIERYLATCHPIKHYIVRDWRRTVYLTLVTWGVAAIASGLANQFYKITQICISAPSGEITEIIPACSVTNNFGIVLQLVIFVAYSSIQAVVVIAMYIAIVRRLHARVGADGIAQQTAVSTRNQVARMVVISISIELSRKSSSGHITPTGARITNLRVRAAGILSLYFCTQSDWLNYV